MFNKIILLSVLFVLLSACAAPTAPASTLAPTQAAIPIAETFTPSPTATQTLAPSATPEPTATAEIGEFIPANDIVLTENLPGYDFKLASDADEKAIFLDTIHNQVAWATSKSKGFESNRAIYEAIIVEHPEWDGIGLGSDYNTVVAFMTEFLNRSGGKMIVADASFNKYTADFNLPVKFEVVEVDVLSPSTANFLALSADNLYGRGGGGIMYVNEDGQLIYKVEVVNSALENALTDERMIYKSWDWTAGGVISDLFRQFISQTVYKNKFSEELKYQLYTKGGNPSNERFYSEVTSTFIESK